MQPRLSSKHNVGMTLLEVGVVVVIIVILAVLLLPALSQAQNKSAKIHCINHLMNISTAAKVWEGDNHDLFPMGVSITNSGSMERVQTGDAVQTFLAVSNVLMNPVILRCPADDTRSAATTFAGLTASNISYFVGLDATNDMDPQMLIFGDCNLEIKGVPVKSGLNSFWTNDLVAWQATRHYKAGNITLADGSVQSTTSTGLQNYLRQTGLATNHFAIP